MTRPRPVSQHYASMPKSNISGILPRTEDGSRWRLLDLGILIGLCAMCMLLPLERGFPSVSVGSILVPVQLVIVPAVFAYAAGISRLVSPETVFTGLPLYQIGLVLVLTLAALRTADGTTVLSSMRVTALHMCTWVLLPPVILGYVRRYGVDRVSTVFACIGCIAALVGLGETLGGYTLPIYVEWQDNHLRNTLRTVDLDVDEASLMAVRRASGTLGNPIVYSSLMVGVAVVACGVRTPWLRNSVIGFTLLAALSTVSRTTFLMGGLLLAGWVLLTRRGKVFTVSSAVAILGVLGFGAISLAAPDRADDLVDLWMQRFGLREGTSAENALYGIEARIDVIRRVWNGLGEGGGIDWLVGRGAYSGSLLGLTTVDGLATLDNAYLSLLYENGLLGLAFFLASFLILIPRQRGQVSIFHFGLVAYLFSGLTFVFYVYMTQNIACVALIAFVEAQRSKRLSQERPT